MGSLTVVARRLWGGLPITRPPTRPASNECPATASYPQNAAQPLVAARMRDPPNAVLRGRRLDSRSRPWPSRCGHSADPRVGKSRPRQRECLAFGHDIIRLPAGTFGQVMVTPSTVTRDPCVSGLAVPVLSASAE